MCTCQVDFLLGLYANFRSECQHLTAAAALGVLSTREQAIEKRAAEIMAELVEQPKSNKLLKDTSTGAGGAVSETREPEAARRCPQPPTTKSKRFRNLVPPNFRRHRQLIGTKQMRLGEKVDEGRRAEAGNELPISPFMSGVPASSQAFARETAQHPAGHYLVLGGINSMESSDIGVAIPGIQVRVRGELQQCASTVYPRSLRVQT